MSCLQEILEYNKGFVSRKAYEPFQTTKFPNKKLIILTCMDTRLGEMLPKAMNLQNGDAKIVKTAGAVVSHAFGSIMRSILLAIYELDAAEICVVSHYDCGMNGLQAEKIIEKAISRGISNETVRTLQKARIGLNEWLTGFSCPEESVAHSVRQIREHPLFPADVPVHGLIIDPETGRLHVVVDGGTC
ncbi:carbonic anhydrase [Paenibacillus sp. BR2-3]|uniref:beta-class carbonic anhydrase n=1 Tax=Paenibacillus sp. BR2-3 TaxID=3048494 RepID=UPI0039777351